MIGRLFKFSMLVLAMVTGLQSAEAQYRPILERPILSDWLEWNAVRLATLDAVKSEINLEDEQLQKLNALKDELQESFRELVSPALPKGLSVEEQDQRIAEIFKKMRTIAEPNTQQAVKILKPEQLKRLKEIAFQQRIQWNLSNALFIDEYIKAANVTEQQQQKAEELNKELYNESGQHGDDRHAQYFWRIREGYKKYAPKFEAILTEDQMTVISEMKGQEFDLTELRPQARRGPQVRRGGGLPGQGTR
jgi:hypothetical protein